MEERKEEEEEDKQTVWQQLLRANLSCSLTTGNCVQLKQMDLH